MSVNVQQVRNVLRAEIDNLTNAGQEIRTSQETTTNLGQRETEIQRKIGELVAELGQVRTDMGEARTKHAGAREKVSTATANIGGVSEGAPALVVAAKRLTDLGAGMDKSNGVYGSTDTIIEAQAGAMTTVAESIGTHVVGATTALGEALGGEAANLDSLVGSLNSYDRLMGQQVEGLE